MASLSVLMISILSHLSPGKCFIFSAAILLIYLTRSPYSFVKGVRVLPPSKPAEPRIIRRTPWLPLPSAVGGTLSQFTSFRPCLILFAWVAVHKHGRSRFGRSSAGIHPPTAPRFGRSPAGILPPIAPEAAGAPAGIHPPLSLLPAAGIHPPPDLPPAGIHPPATFVFAFVFEVFYAGVPPLCVEGSFRCSICSFVMQFSAKIPFSRAGSTWLMRSQTANHFALSEKALVKMSAAMRALISYINRRCSPLNTSCSHATDTR